MQKIEFDGMQKLRSMVAAVLPAASTDDERPDIYGVGLEVIGGEVRALATNGQWAMRVKHSPSYAEDGFRLLIPYPHVVRLLALIGDGYGQARIIRDDKIIRFELERLGRLELNVDGVAEIHLPRIEEFWPTDDPMHTDKIGLNPSIMTKVAKAFKEVAEKPTLRFAFHGSGPIVVTCEEDENADAILMPCLLAGEDEEDDRQGLLFPEPEKPEANPQVGKAPPETDRQVIEEAVEGIRNPGGGLRLVSHGFQSETRKAKKSKASKAKPKPKAKKKAAKKKGK